MLNNQLLVVTIVLKPLLHNFYYFMQQYTEDTGQGHQMSLNFIDSEWGIDLFC